MTKHSPIALFDSGVGGLSVLYKLRRLMPYEDYIYLGDEKNAPYGLKTVREVIDISEGNVKRLLDMGAKALLVACNTATAAAVDLLRERHPGLPIVGTEPAIKPACEGVRGKRILALATPVTVKSERFAELCRQHGGENEIYPAPCERLATMIEQDAGEAELCDYLSEIYERYAPRGFDRIVLGCTHYPFAMRAILAAAPRGVEIFDGASGTARQMQSRLSELGLENPAGTVGRVTLISTDGGDFLRKFYERHCGD